MCGRELDQRFGGGGRFFEFLGRGAGRTPFGDIFFVLAFLLAALLDRRPPVAISFAVRFYLPRSATDGLRWQYLAFYVFTCRVRQPTVSDGSIFRCTTKDRGERRASSSQAPHPSFCLSGQKLSRSAAPPLPTKPTSLGFGGAPVGGPLESPGVMFWAILTCFVRTISQRCV